MAQVTVSNPDMVRKTTVDEYGRISGLSDMKGENVEIIVSRTENDEHGGSEE